MLLGNFLPHLPIALDDLLIHMAGYMGAVAFIYGVLLEKEKSRDAVFVVASASLFVYGLWIHDPLILFAMGGIFFVAVRELIQIVRGEHMHGTTAPLENKPAAAAPTEKPKSAPRAKRIAKK